MTTPPHGQQPNVPGGQPPPPPGAGRPGPGGQPPPPPGYGQQAQGQPAWQSGQQQWGQAQGQPPKKSRTKLWVALGVAGVLVLGVCGGGGLFAFSKLSGGGPQPESALPDTAIGFAKIDLDPAAGQKVDGIQFLRQFPSIREDMEGVDEDDDLRKSIVEGLQEDGELEGVDYEKDIEPWLGQRFGVAVLPADDGGDPDVVVALASTDKDAAEDGLAKMTEGGEGYCTVQEDFAICGEEQSVVDKAVDDAEQGVLADDEQFSQDMDDLGEDGIVTGWFDAGAAKELDPALASTDTEGRVAMAVRFDGSDTLELAGRVNGLPEDSVPSGDGTSVSDLPSDTLGAVAIAGLDEAITKAWPELEKNLSSTFGDGWTQQLDQFESESGLSIPDDVAKALGSDTVIAVGPDAETPKVALRTNGDRGTIDDMVSLIEGEASAMGGGPQVSVKDGDEDRVVVASDDGYADDVASGSGLGDSDAFKNAVPDADGASMVAYVDLAKFVELFGEDMSDEERANAEVLSSAGFTASGEGDHMEFSFRLTTK